MQYSLLIALGLVSCLLCSHSSATGNRGQGPVTEQGEQAVPPEIQNIMAQSNNLITSKSVEIAQRMRTFYEKLHGNPNASYADIDILCQQMKDSIDSVIEQLHPYSHALDIFLQDHNSQSVKAFRDKMGEFYDTLGEYNYEVGRALDQFS